MERIISALSYNDYEYQKKYDVHVRGGDKLEGFDTMFYKCPSCGREFTLQSRETASDAPPAARRQNLTILSTSHGRTTGEGLRQLYFLVRLAA